MSRVYGVVLMTHSNEPEEHFAKINEWMSKRDKIHYSTGNLVQVDDTPGAEKHPEMNIWAGGINYMQPELFIGMVLSLDWYNPGNVVLVISPPEGETRVYRIM